MKTRELVFGVCMLFIGGSVTYFFDTISNKKAHEKRYVEFDLKGNVEVFSKPNISNKKISVLIDGEPVDQLSQLTIPLYNLVNNNDLKDLKIYFDLYNLNGDSIKLVNTSLTRDGNTTDGISILEDLNPSSYKGGMKKGFSISSLNRKENITPSLYATFYFEGTSLPECKVFVDQPDVKDQPGVEARLIDYNNFIKWYDSPWVLPFLLLSILIGYFLMILIVSRFLKYILQKRIIRKRKEKVEFVINTVKNKEFNELFLKPEIMVKEILFIERTYEWEKSSKFDRLVFNYKKPEKKIFNSALLDLQSRNQIKRICNPSNIKRLQIALI